MNAETSMHVDRFRAVLGRRLGLAFDDGSASSLADVLERRARKTKLLPSQYVDTLDAPSNDEELRALSVELTTTETYFFRHGEQLQAFCDVLRARCRASATPVRILSAGCASGEEPYSLAILVREHLAELAPRAFILGIDVNARAIERALGGRYSSWALRSTPPPLHEKWFRRDAGEFVIDASLREMVRFERRNLVEPDSSFWHKGAFDFVLCRNVLMYFTKEASREVAHRLAESIVPGGHLFLGHAETWRADAGAFELRHTHGAFYYCRREHAMEPRISMPPLPPERTEEPARIPAPPVAVLSDERPALRDGPSTEELLSRAVMLARSGDTAAAECACEALVEDDEATAGARYLLALCSESRGDHGGAMEQAALAVRADPSFSLPRFYLGFLARRGGNVREAKRQLAQALALLEREEASRLALYGGGFGRDALIALCRAELASCTGGADG